MKTQYPTQIALTILAGILLPTTMAENVRPLTDSIPVDKKLPAAWVKSLTAPGKPEVVTGEEALMHVGMPVGGLFCGTLYLGGDGKLWLWDIFNDNREGIIPKVIWQQLPDKKRRVRSRDGAGFIEPEDTQPSVFARGLPMSPEMQKRLIGQRPGDVQYADESNQAILEKADQMQQGFAVKIGEKIRPLTLKGWKNVSFTGSYPIGTVQYNDPESPVQITLKAFSPFIPLNTEESSMPCTIMSYTMTNTSNKAINVSIGGWLENAVLCNSGYGKNTGVRINTASTTDFVHVSATARPDDSASQNGRQDIIVEDFEKDDYGDWKVEGTAFDKSPLESSRIPPYMGDIRMKGGRAVVSHNVRNGGSVNDGDNHKGKLTSPEFTIERNFINFLIAGGHKPGKTGIRLIVDGETVRSETGTDSNTLSPKFFDVKDLAGKKAIIEIFDDAEGSWGTVILDHIVQSDSPDEATLPLPESPDFGSMCIAIADKGAKGEAIVDVSRDNPAESLFSASSSAATKEEVLSNPSPLAGVRRDVSIPAKGSVTVNFVISWYFPNIYLDTKGDTGTKDPEGKTGFRHYANQFKSAEEVATHVTDNFKRLSSETELWVNTWYDTTLPRWFMDRTFANTSTLATTTCHRFTNGRFYAWEGVGSCPGTCTHVWQYAQAPARLFPDIERFTREHVDLNPALGFNSDSGQIPMRAEHATGPAIDGHCGRIMGMWREHTMSKDDEFLKRIYQRAKRAVWYILNHDTDEDGILDGDQENTLDAAWYGQIPWTSIEAIGALKAGEQMGKKMNDVEFVKVCQERIAKAQKNIVTKLFNGKWFIQKPAPGREDSFGTYNGSFIDQLFGQSMAYQCGLGTIIDPEKAKTALKSIWTNNFALDLGAYLQNVEPAGRPYFEAGDGGTIMCTNALNEDNPYGGGSWTHGYLNECMTGFEHQYASHLMRVGMIQEALAVTRVIHDRYNAAKRNPYNEIECSDHYSRAMSSYGTFISACGFEYNGPEGIITFAPRMNAANFKAPFTVAEGWGTFKQQQNSQALAAELALKYGKLKLNTIQLQASGTAVEVKLNGKAVPASITSKGAGSAVAFTSPITMKQGDTLTINVK